MNHWLAGEDAAPLVRVAAARSAPGTERALRSLDLALALPACVLLALPLLLLRRHAVSQPVRGRAGRTFTRQHLQLPDALWARILRTCGAKHWPVVGSVLRGDMAWVGPRPRALDEPPAPAAERVRPGLFNPWFIRQRTAVHYGDEARADAHYLAHRGLRHDLGLLLRGALVSLLPPAPVSPPAQVCIVDVRVDNLDMGEALARLQALLQAATPQQVSFVNPACVNIAARHRGYRRALARAALVLPDGIGLRIGSLLLGTPLKQNVNGTDLFPRLCDLLQARGASVYLLGGEPGRAERVAAEMASRWPRLRVAGCRDGYFDTQQEAEVVAAVRASGADVLLVARGAPTQDLFIDRHLPLLGVRLAMGVGGLFDFVTGRVSRAPLWMRETGLEWVWRLQQEPGRMWRRYLLGNVSFLARVGLQALGLRRPAQDELPPARTEAPAGVRAVVFATDRVDASLPLPPDTPVALLPLGHQTVVEHLLEQLARAGVGDVDLVACAGPEALRERLGEGERWGLRLRWRLVRDGMRPYAALPAAALATTDRLLLLHADRLTPLASLQDLLARDQVHLQAGDEGTTWVGRASLHAAQVAALGVDHDRQSLGQALRAVLPVGLPDAEEAGPALQDAGSVLLAQHRWLDGPGLAAVPASWIRQPWGAMSPQAVVDPGARIVGPVLVGAGCWIERDAEVGPHVVLSRDVVLTAGTTVRDTLLLPQTYVGAGLELVRTLASGTRVRHVALDVETPLPASDALVLSLGQGPRRTPSVLGLAAAALALTCVGPALALHTAGRRLQGRGPAWRSCVVVVGRDEADQALHLAVLRCARPDASARERVWAGLAGLLDVLARRRCWIGMRPRTAGQWYALRPEWQEVLADSPVGLIHAPALGDASDPGGEARAVADVYAARVPALRVLWQWLQARLRTAGTGSSSPPARLQSHSATLSRRALSASSGGAEAHTGEVNG